MNISDRGLDIIRQEEGLRLIAYKDSIGKWTIGYGHTKGVNPGDTCSKDQAEAWLVEDCAEAENIVTKNVTAPLTENQFSALVSFVFNVGPGKRDVKDGFVTLKSGNQSTLLRMLNLKDFAAAAYQIGLWNKAGGVMLPGLVKRREAEKRLFMEQ